MNLSKQMLVAGIGCGESCICTQTFIASLDEIQQAMLSHMIERGAEVHLDKIMSGAQEPPADEDATLKRSMNQVFADLFSGDAAEDFDPSEVLNEMMLRASGIDLDAAPYEDELGDHLKTALAEVPDDLQKKLERHLRLIIATKANNDPTRVEIVSDDQSIWVRVRKAAEAEDSKAVA